MKTMYVWLSLCLLAALSAGGCAAGGPPAEDLTLKNDVVIDGVNVSGMTVAEARRVLNGNAASALSDTCITLSLPGSDTRFSALSLSAGMDVEASLAAAAKLPRRGGERALSSPRTVDRADLRATLAAFAAENAAPAQDAGAEVDSGSATPVTYRPEQFGVEIDTDALYACVVGALAEGGDQRIAVPHTRLAPAVTLDEVQRQTALLSEFTTSFSGGSLSADNRVYNIRLAAERINGVVLSDGEEFDCNAMLGDRTAENGWREAAGIRNGKYEQEYGGGVCQLSSTLFNAVLMADLPVTERHPHSWPMGYVDIGRDATISTGGKNFRFVNASGGPLSIFAYVDTDAKTLTVSLYGRPRESCAYIRIVSEKTGLTEPAGEVVMLDETLPYQTRVVDREPRDGKTAATYRERYNADGTLLSRELLYEDAYRAIDGVTYVSTDLYYS